MLGMIMNALGTDTQVIDLPLSFVMVMVDVCDAAGTNGRAINKS